MTDEATRLPPIPDRFLSPAAKDNVIAWLRGLALPERHAARELRRWAQYVGITLTASDYTGLRPGSSPPYPEE